MGNSNSLVKRRKFINQSGDVSRSIFNVSREARICKDSLNAYLSLGYVPGENTIFEGVKCIGSFFNSDVNSLEELFVGIKDFTHDKNSLKDLIISSVEKTFSSGNENIVPLSGGMDSRIILAALCELTEAQNIHTYTFGVPGSLDFDIANSLAKNIKTKHQNFSAGQTEYSIDGLIRAAIATDGNTEVFHPLVLNRVADFYGPEVDYWSGFAGDVVGGGFGAKLEGGDAKLALLSYENRGIHYSDGLNHNFLDIIGDGEGLKGYVGDVEACFWANHMERYTEHHLFRNDMNIHAPMISPEFLKFFFTLNRTKRENKSFFNTSFTEIFPDVFVFPTVDYGYKYSRKNYFYQLLFTTNYYSRAIGWRLFPSIITHPSSAYIDLKNGINNRADIRSCVDILLADLMNRNIVDNDRVKMFLTKHRENNGNYTKDLINLASLEVILKASNR